MIRKLQAFPSFTGAAFAVGVFVAALVTLAGEKAASAQARAQQFGDQGQLVVTAENLFGFSTERFGQDTANNNEASTTYNQFNLLYRGWAAPSGGGTGASFSTAHGPWVGGHFFIIPNLSLGATLGIQTSGGSSTSTNPNNGTTVTNDRDSAFAFMLLPKVGYALMINNMIGFWFRGGPGFMRASTTSARDSNDGTAASYGLISLDALFVVTPVQYFGFYAGPQGIFSFTGSVSSTSNSTTVSWDASYRAFTIDAGVFGYFDL
jgi:hypothetical protein